MENEPRVNRYRFFCRASGVYYIQDNKTGKQESLRTRDPEEAERLAFHRNESARLAAGHRQIGIGYMQASDPEIRTRTWSYVMDYFCDQPNKPSTTKRKKIAVKDPALQPLRACILIETTPEQLLTVLKNGTVSTNCYLRKLHNLARDMEWLPKDILKRHMWPKVRYGDKRAITLEEHRRIVAVAPTQERKRYYEVLWHSGGSQSDIALLTAEQIDQDKGIIRFKRIKVDGRDVGNVNLIMGPTLEEIISALPSSGPLFPTLASVGENDRATAFQKHCLKAGVEGVTLHSYRYAVAQRADNCGYNKRHSMAMLGHSREATHDGYARGGATTIPSLEEYELAFEAASQERERLRIEKREKIIKLRDHLAGDEPGQEKTGTT